MTEQRRVGRPLGLTERQAELSFIFGSGKGPDLPPCPIHVEPDPAPCREWPLVAFTVALQFACGLSFAATLLESLGGHSLPTRILAVAIFSLIVFGMMASLLHLGRPLAAWRSLLNLRRSRLSLEILLTTVFAALALAYAAVPSATLAAATLIGGVATVVSSARIYRLPAQPLWNSGWVPASFLGTALLFGGMAGVLADRTPNAGLRRLLLLAMLAGSVMALLSAIRTITVLARVPGGQLLSIPRVTCLVIHLLLTAVLPAWMAWQVGSSRPAPPFMFVTLVLVSLGAVLGRVLMYTFAAALPRF